MNKQKFNIIEDGRCYYLPMYKIKEGGLTEQLDAIQEIRFIRGNGSSQYTYGEYLEAKKLLDGMQSHGLAIPEDVYQELNNVIMTYERSPGKSGILHETLLAMMIHDLKLKNKEVPSREGSMVITKLEEALMWAELRTKNRTNAGTLNTYKK